MYSSYQRDNYRNTETNEQRAYRMKYTGAVGYEVDGVFYYNQDDEEVEQIHAYGLERAMENAGYTAEPLTEAQKAEQIAESNRLQAELERVRVEERKRSEAERQRQQEEEARRREEERLRLEAEKKRLEAEIRAQNELKKQFKTAVQNNGTEDTHLASRLLRYHGDILVNLRADNQTPTFVLAAALGNVRVVRDMKAAGFDMLLRDTSRASALHRAVRNGHMAMVRVLIEEFKFPINSMDDSRETALHWAAREGKEEVVKFLSEHGADCSLKNDAGKTARDVAHTRLSVDAKRALLPVDYTKLCDLASLI